MKFRVYEPGRNHWWVKDSEETVRHESLAYVFDSESESEMDNVRQDFVKAKCRVKIVRED